MFGGFLGGLASGLIGGVAKGFLGDYFGRRQARYEADLSRAAFNDSARLSWDMWHAQNAYNTPKAQMQRFSDAGLNPHLIYGQTNTSAPISVPSQKPAHVSNYDFDMMLGQQLTNGALQNQMLREQIASSSQNRAVQAVAAADQHATSVQDREVKKILSEDTHLNNGINRRVAELNYDLLNGDSRFYNQYGSRAGYFSRFDPYVRDKYSGEIRKLHSDVVNAPLNFDGSINWNRLGTHAVDAGIDVLGNLGSGGFKGFLGRLFR